MAFKVSQKQLQIDKASQRIIVVTSAAAFVVIFCLVASQSLFSQMIYQNKVISGKKTALSALEQNQKNADNLKTAYAGFVGTPQNVIGGIASGNGQQDGDNAKIVLDALPSKYDFPALATSLEKLLIAQSVTIKSITGTDDELAQGGTAGSGTPQAVPMPFQISASGNYDAIKKLSQTFEASIRPIQVQTLTLSGSDGQLQIAATAQTFYQPEKTFAVGKKVVQ